MDKYELEINIKTLEKKLQDLQEIQKKLEAEFNRENYLGPDRENSSVTWSTWT
jgi:hypothetical protein